MAFTFLLAFGGVYAVDGQVSADTATELKEEKATVDVKIQKLNVDVETLQTALQKETKKFDETKKEITKLNTDIKEAEKRINNRTEIISEQLTAYQVQDSNLSLYIDEMFGSNRGEDLMGHVSFVQTIIESDQALIDEQHKDYAQLLATKQQLKDIKEQQQQRFQQIQEQESELQGVLSENKTKSLRLKAKIADAKEKKREQEAEALRNLQGNIETKTATEAPTLKNGLAAAISEAKKYEGMPYEWGGSNPTTSFDCSGLVQWSYAKAGISLPRTSGEQYLATTKITRDEAKAGDLVFFSYGSGIAHVGIYLGDGKMIDAQNSGVVIESLDWWEKYLVGFGRVK